MVVREGRPEDVEAIAAVHTRAWWHGYEDVLPYERLTAQDAGDRQEMWAGLLAGADRGVLVLVVTTGDDAVHACAAVGPSREEDRAGDGELYALYVDPPAQGAGVGRMLLDAATERLRATGASFAVVRVFAGDEHGRGLCASAGWAQDGPERPGDDDHAATVRLRRALGPS